VRALGLYAAAYALILEVMLVAAMHYWPSFEENIDALRLAIPVPVVQDMFDVLAARGVDAYVIAQQFFKGCNTLGTAAAVLFAAGAVAGEVHRGTLEIWLARPFSRARILSERWLAGALALAVPIFLSSATIPWLAERVGESVELRPLMLCSAHQLVFLLTIYSLTFLLSTVGANPIRIALTVLFLTTLEFALYMVKTVTHASYYRLADFDDFLAIFDRGVLDWGVCGPLLAISALLFVAAQLAFRRRVP
jgi:ABC-2 type transport system permease protein